MTKVFAVTCSVAAMLALTACSDTPKNQAGGGGGALSGQLYWVSSADIVIHKVDLATGVDKELGSGHSVSVAPDGKLIILGKTGIEESDESLVSTTKIKKDDVDSFDYADHNFAFPTVSPDGTKIAYNGANSAAYVIERAGGAVVARFESKGTADKEEDYLNPAWTPDGRIVTAGGFFNPGLYISDAGLKTMTKFDPDLDQPGQPVVSPDGTKVAFVLKKLIFTLNIDGTGLTQIDPGGEDPTDEDDFPFWSPDGTQIGYSAYAGTVRFRAAAGGGASTDLFKTYPALNDKLLVMSSTVAMSWLP